MAAAPPTVYVHPLPEELRATYLYDNLTADNHNHQWSGELELYRRLREYPHRAPPESADMLLVPTMFAQAFAQWKKGGAARIQRLNAEVERVLRASPHWESRRRAHAIFALRCGGPPSDRVRRTAVAAGTWPSLWDSNATMLCTEPTTSAVHGHGVLMPYHSTARCERSAEPSPDEKLVFFSGSQSVQRQRRAPWIAALRAAPDGLAHIVGAASRTHALNFTAIERGMASSLFTLSLIGHTGTRKSVFDAIRCGSLLLLACDDAPLPFAAEVDYARFTLHVPERADPPAVLDRLRAWVRTHHGWIRAARRAVRDAAPLLDYSQPAMVELTLRTFVRVSRDGHAAAALRRRGSTVTPVPPWEWSDLGKT